MTDKLAQNDAPQAQDMTDALKGWVMVALTLIFVILYGAALIGWLKPLADEKMITRLEPIIFVIIGYYFGRLPAQQNEKTLKDEIIRQTQKADASQHAKEQSQQAREALEEKLKNAVASISQAVQVSSDKGVSASGAGADAGLRHALLTTLKILNS
ncbi:MAG TPA: hypothetical protein VGC87_01595 [Pyrinomonadaceae bacterium]|jgi:hypothetical protein